MIQIKNRYSGDVIKEVTSLSNSDLRYSDLSNSDLSYSDLRYSDLSYSDLSNSNLRYSNLRGSDLSNSDLRDSDLRGSNLSNSDLRDSDLSYSNLRYSNLRGSNLRGSDLRGSDLRNIIGNGREIKSLQIGTYMVSYHKDILNIGCQSHTLNKWLNFTDEEIDRMDKGTSLDWWKLNKDILITLVKREIQ